MHEYTFSKLSFTMNLQTTFWCKQFSTCRPLCRRLRRLVGHDL